jgi:hypothetical protein
MRTFTVKPGKSKERSGIQSLLKIFTDNPKYPERWIANLGYSVRKLKMALRPPQ